MYPTVVTGPYPGHPEAGAVYYNIQSTHVIRPYMCSPFIFPFYAPGTWFI